MVKPVARKIDKDGILGVVVCGWGNGGFSFAPLLVYHFSALISLPCFCHSYQFSALSVVTLFTPLLLPVLSPYQFCHFTHFTILAYLPGVRSITRKARLTRLAWMARLSLSIASMLVYLAILEIHARVISQVSLLSQGGIGEVAIPPAHLRKARRTQHTNIQQDSHKANARLTTRPGPRYGGGYANSTSRAPNNAPRDIHPPQPLH